MVVLLLSLYLQMLQYVLILQNFYNMKLLYKFSVRNEQEIRNDLPARIIRVVADNIQDATRGFVDESSLIQSVEFVSPVIVVSSSDLTSYKYDSSGPFFFIIYRDDSDDVHYSVVKSDSSASANSALQRLVDSLDFTPKVDKVLPVENTIF